MPKQYTIVLIGSGNVATHLGIALLKSGNKILQVYSRDSGNAKKLATKLKTSSTNSISKIMKGADIYLIAVKDDVIEKKAKELNVGNAIVVHTSGSAPLSVLNITSKNTGVLYPLQTFSKNTNLDIANVPVCIEASNTITKKVLFSLAKGFSPKVYSINSEKRKMIHLAAVFANNFSNHMYVIAEKIAKKNNFPFELLVPLINETANKIQHIKPSLVQTGPAKRGDKKIISEHLNLLKSDQELGRLYKLLSHSIIRNS